MHRSNYEIAWKLIGLVKPLAGYMVLAIVLGVLGFLAAIAIPVVGVSALLAVGGYGGLLTLETALIVLIISALARGFLRYGEQLCNHYIAFKVLALMRDRVFRALRKLAPAKLETKEKGNLVSILTSDIELLEVFFAHTISPVAIALLTSLILVGIMCVINPIFALIAAFAYVLIGVVIPLLTSKAGSSLGIHYRAEAGGLTSYYLDSLRGLREIIQYNQGRKRLEGIEERTSELGEKLSRLKLREGVFSAITSAVILLSSVTVLTIGSVQYLDGSVTALQLILGFTLILSSFGPVLALSNLANNLVHTFAAGNRVIDILEEEPITVDVCRGIDINFEGLSCNDISFGYETEEVLEGFEMKVCAGQIVGIMGKSGSGKSTLLRLLMRFWDVDSGTIQISNSDIRAINTQSLRDNESFVTQETLLFDDTIANNIRIAKLDATDEEVAKAAQQAALHDFICSLPQGYDSRVGELGDSLSGGEKQRLGLARAFLHDAPLILLDEPTSNLDSLNEGIVLKSLRDKAQEKTVLLVSHRASTMAIASTVLSMTKQKAS